MIEKLVIRTVNERDVDKIVELEKKIFGFDGYPRYLVEYLVFNADFFIVACIDDEIVGYICGETKLDKGHIITLAVDNRYRRRGIGSKLLKLFIETEKRRGIKMIYLEVSVKNKVAIKFYEKHGFKISGILRRYYRDNSDAYIMILNL